MSIEAMNWALAQRVGSPAGKAVLMILANRANHAGRCWPGIDGIAEQTELGRRTVIAKIQELEQAGFLEVEHRGGTGEGRMSNVYLLHIAPKCIDCTLPSEETTDAGAPDALQANDSNGFSDSECVCDELPDGAMCKSCTLGLSATDAGQCATDAGNVQLSHPNHQLTHKGTHKGGADAPAFDEIENLHMPAWEAWEAYRRKSRLRKYTTDLMARKLADLPPDQQMACVEDSISKQYQGLFPEKFNYQTGANGRPPTPTDPYYDEIRRAVANAEH